MPYITDTKTQMVSTTVVQHITCKQFVSHYGKDFFNYECELNDQLTKVKAKQQMGTDPAAIFSIIEKRGDPLFISDLDIELDDLIKIGITNDKEQKKALSVLMDDCLKHPEDNNQRYLIGLIGRAYGGGIKKWLFNKSK